MPANRVPRPIILPNRTISCPTERASRGSVRQSSPGADVGYAFLFGAVTGFINHSVPTPDYKSGWGELAKRTLVGMTKAGLAVPVRAARNVANGDKWDTGLLNTAVSGALWGSLGALQIKAAMKQKLDFSNIAAGVEFF